ncbi:MAG: Nucleotide-binding universal stress protein, UspA family [Candidatus Electronema aureum]|uniref:Nucleotide-binding universal stress protein, UspA family n=1 Tax=Candidatus Electronema aureum TaxID=2005002 RepID=A0A521G0H0_9BACT|nr:MAG: Nucleotide-binding universal stress protein, UspA family [Candidatus Electronema aureum]
MSGRLIGQAEVIALATDGSSYTDGAVQEAIFLAQTCGAKIVVLNVIPIDSESMMGAYTFSAGMSEEIKSHLDNVSKMAKDHGIECDVVFEESFQPDKSIVELARQHKADILIMGRHGRRGLLKLLVGSMTAKVIGHGFPRVLVVPKDFTLGGERILVAVDGSVASDMAAEEAIDMGMHCSNLKEIYVLSVTSSEEGLDQAKELTEAICKKGQGKAQQVAFHPLAVVGKHAPEIIAAQALENKVDMILVGGHGKGLSKLLMGHVTEKVIGKAHCAVLVLEKKEGE